MNKLTIIMPVYNNLPFLKEAINSVIKQKFKSWELLISDDKSTDGSVDFLKKIKHKKIKVFFQRKNLGIYGNCKFLNSKSKTSIIKILCADDKLVKNSLLNTYNFMKKNTSCKIMACGDINYKNINSDNITRQKEFYSKLSNKEYLKLTPRSSIIAFTAFGNLCGNLSRVTYRKVNDGMNPFFNKKFSYAGDFNAWVRFSNKYGIYLITKKLIFVRNHPNRGTYNLNKNNDLFRQVSEIYKFLSKNIDQKHYPLLKKHLLLNDLPQRIPTYLKFLILGKFKEARKTFFNLPFSIKFYECFFYAPLFKFRNHRFNKINKFYRLKVINLIKENL